MAIFMAKMADAKIFSHDFEDRYRIFSMFEISILAQLKPFINISI